MSRLLLCVWLLAVCSTACSTEATEPASEECDQGSICRDSDCDTICDSHEGDPTDDADGDGTPNYLDTDSDGDSVPDREEAGDEDRATEPVDQNLDGIPDFLQDSWPLRAEPMPDARTLPRPDASMPQQDGAVADTGIRGQVDSGPIVEDLCPAATIVPPMCAAEETDLCDGLDNDCDGTLDGEALCGCVVGSVRACFTGPPGRRGVGACQDGQQVCLGDEFTRWGPCVGAQGPRAEVCDGVDNDCNGCTDEIEGCVPVLSCPAPGDPRIAEVRPFQPIMLDAADFYSGADARSFRWEIDGTPCDRLFRAVDPSAQPSNGRLSYHLDRASSQRARVTYALSGNYAVRLTVDTPEGEIACNWVQRVAGPGLRVELCWDHTGPVANAAGTMVDLDLHLGRKGKTARWLSHLDCYWDTCKGAQTPSWDYGSTYELEQCTGEAAPNFAAYSMLSQCLNPRLDVDNQLNSASRQAYLPENINLDGPSTGDGFRVMVRYNASDQSEGFLDESDAGQVPTVEAHPLVNVYCGGELVASYGGDPAVLGDEGEVGGLDAPGKLWRAADILVTQGGRDARCTATPIEAEGGGYDVRAGDLLY